MADARFLKLLADKRHENSEAMFTLKLGDSHGHARLKGIREGLDMAEKAFKDAMRFDDEVADMRT